MTPAQLRVLEKKLDGWTCEGQLVLVEDEPQPPIEKATAGRYVLDAERRGLKQVTELPLPEGP